jgi:hypothetical protein
MIPRAPHEQLGARTWTGERLVSFTCRVGDVTARLPTVVRQPFRVPERRGDDVTDEELARALAAELEGKRTGGALSQGAPAPCPENPYFDTIVRLPSGHIDGDIPLGIVSKRYRLVQYAELIERVGAGLAALDLGDWQSFETHVWHTDLGSRAHLSIHLPPRFRLRIGDADLDLTVECFNSVERSWALRVGMGWIRGICGNGLFIGNVTASIRRSHAAGLSVEDIPAVIGRGLTVAQTEAMLWQTRSRMTVPSAELTEWVDTTLSKKWGVVTAARALHIIRTGQDAAMLDRAEKSRASERSVVAGHPVPGSRPQNEDVFRIAQVLSWLANRPREWGSALERRRQIPALVRPLTRVARAQPAPTLAAT